jgi:hypothetical protein
MRVAYDISLDNDYLPGSGAIRIAQATRKKFYTFEGNLTFLIRHTPLLSRMVNTVCFAAERAVFLFPTL